MDSQVAMCSIVVKLFQPSCHFVFFGREDFQFDFPCFRVSCDFYEEVPDLTKTLKSSLGHVGSL